MPETAEPPKLIGAWRSVPRPGGQVQVHASYVEDGQAHDVRAIVTPGPCPLVLGQIDGVAIKPFPKDLQQAILAFVQQNPKPGKYG